MLLNQEKFLSAAKTLVESRFATLNPLGGNAAEAGRRAVALNVADRQSIYRRVGRRCQLNYFP
jgi:hypothetical protein